MTLGKFKFMIKRSCFYLFLALLGSSMTLCSINVLHLLSDMDLSGVHMLRLKILDRLNQTGEFKNYCIAAKTGPMLEQFQERCTSVAIASTPEASAQEGSELARWMHFICQVKKMVIAHKIEIIHSGHWQTSLCAKILARTLDVKVIEDYHFLSDLWGEAWRRPFDNEVEGTFNPKIIRVCAAQGIADSFGFKESDETPCYIIPNAVDPENFRFRQEWRDEIRARYGLSSSCYVLGGVGRLAKEKNFELLIDIFAQFVESKPFTETHLLIIGDGPEREALERLIAKKHLEEYVTITGFAGNVAHYYSALDALFCTSTSEGFSLAVLEGLASGLPVASTIKFYGFETILKDVNLDSILQTYNKHRPGGLSNMQELRRSCLPDFYHQGRMLRQYQELYDRVLKI